MKEKNTIGNNSNQNNGNVTSSGSTTTASNITSSNSTNSVSNASNSNNTLPDQQSFLSPYDSNNFMAPPIGGNIKCVTCLGNNVQGKVIAYDHQTKMLALRSSIPNKPGYYDFSMVNVSWCSNLEVIEEPSEPPEPLANLNISKLERRKTSNINNKYKEINSLGTDVSQLAQHLYFTIYKTLNEVDWEGKNIIVMDSVVVKPPYDVTSCFSRNGDNNQAVEHVKKIVKKFNEEYNNISNQTAQ